MRSWSSSGRPITSRIVSLAERTAVCELRRIVAGDLLGGRDQLVVGDDARDEVAAQRALGVDRLGGQQHLERHAGAAGVDQPHDPAVAVVVAAARLERAELRPLGGDPDVARQRQLEPAGQRPAVDGGDRRLGDPVQAAREPAEAGRDVVAHPARRRLLDDRRDVGLEVGAGAEGVAGAGEDRDVDRVVVAEVLPGRPEQLVQLGVDRVLGLGPVDASGRRSGRASRTSSFGIGRGHLAVGCRRMDFAPSDRVAALLDRVRDVHGGARRSGRARGRRGARPRGAARASPYPEIVVELRERATRRGALEPVPPGRALRPRPDQLGVRDALRADGPQRRRADGLQLRRARHRQHGDPRRARHRRAEGALARSRCSTARSARASR